MTLTIESLTQAWTPWHYFFVPVVLVALIFIWKTHKRQKRLEEQVNKIYKASKIAADYCKFDAEEKGIEFEDY